jgi:two-component system chemotaxis sensor kinase CheA
MKSSRKEFIAEAEDLIDEAQRLILEIQDTFSSGLNPDTINALFRTMHTLKGVAGLFNLQGITDLSHALETLMDDVRLGKIEMNRDVVNFLFRNADILRNLVEEIGAGSEEEDVTPFVKDIESFRSSQKDGKDNVQAKGLIDDSILKVLSEYEEHRLKSNIREGKGIYLAKAVFSLDVFDTSLEALTALIRTKGELISSLPTSENIPEGSIGFNLMFGSALEDMEIRNGIDVEVETLLKRKGSEEPPSVFQSQQDTHLKSTTTTVRVDIEKLDRILNTIGELTLAKGAVKRIGTELVEQYGQSSLVYDVHKISETLERRFAELQHQVLEIRMVPIGQIFSRLAQVVRRYSREIEKQIDLTVFGEDTEIDKYIAEEIVDPLMHLVRNAIDHGIEPPGERKKKGKKESGTIVLRAYQKGNHVVIELKDDGAGVDVRKVKKKAVEKGLIEAGAELDEEKVIDFIFTPGFSTKDLVSEVSGRGVGLDVVKDKVSALGGFVGVETSMDAGSTFMLTLPITLAIIKALIVRVGDDKFAVPLTSMSETLMVEQKDIQSIESKEVYYLRGDMLPMIRVSKFFGVRNDAAERCFAVVVGLGDRKAGLLVDELYGQQEIVIKSLGGYLQKLKGFAGAAEIGRHEVILVLDAEALIGDAVTRQKGGAYV